MQPTRKPKKMKKTSHYLAHGNAHCCPPWRKYFLPLTFQFSKTAKVKPQKANIYKKFICLFSFDHSFKKTPLIITDTRTAIVNPQKSKINKKFICFVFFRPFSKSALTITDSRTAVVGRKNSFNNQALKMAVVNPLKAKKPGQKTDNLNMRLSLSYPGWTAVCIRPLLQ